VTGLIAGCDMKYCPNLFDSINKYARYCHSVLDIIWGEGLKGKWHAR